MAIGKYNFLGRTIQSVQIALVVLYIVCSTDNALAQYYDYEIDTIVCASDDNALKFYYWDTYTGGTSPWLKGYSQYRTSNGKIVTSEVEDDVPEVRELHTIKKNDGSVYYIAKEYSRSSGNEGCTYLKGYAIKNNKLVEVSVVDGVGNPEKEKQSFYAYHCIADWYFATKGEGWGWIFEYDKKNKTFYIPILDYTVRPPNFTDRYRVYSFNGQRFVDKGEQPHKDLHKSLANYKKLALYFKTKNYTVRVDILDDAGTARYASWEKNADMSQPPALIIIGGKKIENGGSYDSYSFENKSYEYFVGSYPTTHSNGRTLYDDYLVVKKNGKIILKEERL